MTARCKDVRNMIYNGATTEKLEKHFHVGIRSLMASMLKYHYTTTIGRERFFPKLKEQLAKNNENAIAKKALTATTTANVAVEKTMEEHPEAIQKVKDTTTDNSQGYKKTIYVVETGSMLSIGIDALLSKDNGEAIFYVPRSCINELEKQSRTIPMAREILNKIYGTDIFKKRFFPVSVSTECFSEMLNPNPNYVYKHRTHNIVNATLSLALSHKDEDNIMTKVITASGEVNNLLSSIIRAEKLHEIVQCFYVRPRSF